MFYPVEDSAMTLTGGDTVAARCTMVSYRDRITWVTNSHLNIFCPSKHSKHYFQVGATAEDEMCNFYMMYWVEGREKLGTERCTSVGPPVYTWDRWISILYLYYLNITQVAGGRGSQEHPRRGGLLSAVIILYQHCNSLCKVVTYT